MRTSKADALILARCEKCKAVMSLSKNGTIYLYPHPEGTRTTKAEPPCVPDGFEDKILAQRPKERAPRALHVVGLHGWGCPACRAFNSESSGRVQECRRCGAARPR